jgi:putative sigma-54 modulation protein
MGWTVVFGRTPAANSRFSLNLTNATSMQINISTRHGDISDATKEKITQKVEKVQRFFERLSSIDVTVDLSKADEPKIEVHVRPEKRDDFVASYQSGDMFGSLDQVISKLEQQIKKHKEKLQERGKNVSDNV